MRQEQAQKDQMAGNRVNVIGWYGKGNCGDESYKLAFPKVFPNYDLVFSDAPVSADAYILGGGDIVADCFLDPLKHVGSPKHIFSVSMPQHANKSKLEDFKTIAVRDNFSVENANKLGLQASYLPDFAFALESDSERGRKLLFDIFARERQERYQNIVGVVVNAHVMPHHDSPGWQTARFEHFAYSMAMMMDNTNASFVFLPFGTSMPWDDRAAHAAIASKCKFHQKNLLIYDKLGVQDTLDIIGALDCLISSRLHSSIFSLVAGTPFIDVTHNHKNKNLLKTIRYEQVSLPFTGFCKETLQREVASAIDNREQLSKEIRAISAREKNLLAEVERDVPLV